MKNLFPILLLIIASCNSLIKNEDKIEYEEPGTEVNASKSDSIQVIKNNVQVVSKIDDIIGFWVGDFKAKENESDNYSKRKVLYVDEGFSWDRTNKINISIDSIRDKKVYGHSVVAGNSQNFIGSYTENDNSFDFDLKEPKKGLYDGAFKFSITKGSTNIVGEWTAYNKIDVSVRIYNLSKNVFVYNKDQKLEEFEFVDWNKKKNVHYDPEIEEYFSEFASATPKIFNINASSTLLKKEDVENLKKGDLLIIRNAIYARHGYSFKNRPLRVFFDKQSWYIPVYSDIKNDFTEIEIANIKLLLRYEKNAKEYYDYFGRG